MNATTENASVTGQDHRGAEAIPTTATNYSNDHAKFHHDCKCCGGPIFISKVNTDICPDCQMWTRIGAGLSAIQRVMGGVV